MKQKLNAFGISREQRLFVGGTNDVEVLRSDKCLLFEPRRMRAHKWNITWSEFAEVGDGRQYQLAVSCGWGMVTTPTCQTSDSIFFPDGTWSCTRLSGGRWADVFMRGTWTLITVGKTRERKVINKSVFTRKTNTCTHIYTFMQVGGPPLRHGQWFRTNVSSAGHTMNLLCVSWPPLTFPGSPLPHTLSKYRLPYCSACVLTMSFLIIVTVLKLSVI